MVEQQNSQTTEVCLEIMKFLFRGFNGKIMFCERILVLSTTFTKRYDNKTEFLINVFRNNNRNTFQIHFMVKQQNSQTTEVWL